MIKKKELQKIFNKYNKNNNWLAGNFIPPEEKERYRIMFIGEKPSYYFKKRENLRSLGNYNATSTDKSLHCYLQKYNIGKIYITDMVKTEGKSGADFKKEWNSDFEECLRAEIDYYKPKLIVFISKDVEKLFKNYFSDLEIETFGIHHPSYVFRWNKYKEWDNQFKELKGKI